MFSCRKSNIERTITLNKNFGYATPVFLSHTYPWKKTYVSNIEIFTNQVLNTESLDDNMEHLSIKLSINLYRGFKSINKSTIT